VVGLDWPSVTVLHEMLVEALKIINALFDGGYLTRRNQYYYFDAAKLSDLPTQRADRGGLGRRVLRIVRPLADHMIAVEPTPRWP
jgi:alkanesulfonate monooxygenase SsuD/methylene tetrahydromethanopterin reductase-like flavin-dependent oxidoreductase (luciferase family)